MTFMGISFEPKEEPKAAVEDVVNEESTETAEYDFENAEADIETSDAEEGDATSEAGEVKLNENIGE
jgi:hypothetical protein